MISRLIYGISLHYVYMNSPVKILTKTISKGQGNSIWGMWSDTAFSCVLPYSVDEM